MKRGNLHLLVALCIAGIGSTVHAAPVKSPVQEQKTPKPLTADDRQHILNDPLKVTTSISAIPSSVQAAIRTALKGTPPLPFPIAEAGASYNSTDVVGDGNLPFRRLIFSAVSHDYCLVAYEKGGIGYTRCVALYRLKGDKAELAWTSYIQAPCQTLADLRAAVVAKKYQDKDWL